FCRTWLNRRRKDSVRSTGSSVAICAGEGFFSPLLTPGSGFAAGPTSGAVLLGVKGGVVSSFDATSFAVAGMLSGCLESFPATGAGTTLSLCEGVGACTTKYQPPAAARPKQTRTDQTARCGKLVRTGGPDFGDGGVSDCVSAFLNSPGTFSARHHLCCPS